MKPTLKSAIQCGIVALTACVTFTNCGGDDESTSNALLTAYTILNTQAQGVAGLGDYSSSSSSASIAHLATAFGSEWDTGNNFPGSTEGASAQTAKEWMGGQLTSDVTVSDISIFYRINQSLQVFCYIAVGVGSDNLDANNYPNDGIYNIVMNSTMITSMETTCGGEINGDIEGGTIVLTISTPSDTTYYDKLADVNLTVGSTTVIDQDFYFAADSDGSVAIATQEASNSGADTSRFIGAYDASTSTVRVSYASGPVGSSVGSGDNAEYMRLLHDGSDNGFLLHASGNGTTQIRYVLAGRPETGTNFSLSMDAANELTGSAPWEACVAQATGDIATDNARCVETGNDLNGADVTAVTILSNFHSGWDSTNYDTVSATTTLPFTSTSNVTSAAIHAE